MLNFVTTICLSLVIVLILATLFLFLSSRAVDKKYKTVFNNIYGQSPSRPICKINGSYGFLHFTVTFKSKEELDAANQNGLNQRFSKEIEELLKNTGSNENPFQVERAIFFTSEESQ